MNNKMLIQKIARATRTWAMYFGEDGQYHVSSWQSNNPTETSILSTNDESVAQSTCDILNLRAVLEMICIPTSDMVDAAAWFESPNHGPRSNVGVWRAMIDHLIAQCGMTKLDINLL